MERGWEAMVAGLGARAAAVGWEAAVVGPGPVAAGWGMVAAVAVEAARVMMGEDWAGRGAQAARGVMAGAPAAAKG